jgi:hypothetical protein
VGRDKNRLGSAVPAAIVLFSVLITAAIIAFSIAMHMVEMMRMQSLGVYSLEYINRAILHCIANPQSSAEVMVSLSSDEIMEFAENTVLFTSKNKVEKSFFKQLMSQSNQYEAMINLQMEDLGNGIRVSYERKPSSLKIRFTHIKITQGSYRIIFFSTSFTDIEVIVISL